MHVPNVNGGETEDFKEEDVGWSLHFDISQPLRNSSDPETGLGEDDLSAFVAKT